MLHIILLILKTIGIILACIIGLILLLIFLVLFVPVRYRGEASYEKQPLYTVKVGWIPGIVSFLLTNSSGKNCMRLRIFGFSLIDTSKEKKKKGRKEKKTSNDEKVTGDKKVKSGKKESSGKQTREVPVSGSTSSEQTVAEQTVAEKSVTEKSENRADKSDHTTECSKHHETTEKRHDPEKPADNNPEKPTDNDQQKLKTEKVKQRSDQGAKKDVSFKKRRFSVKEKLTGAKETIIQKLQNVSASLKKLKDKKDKVGEIFFSDQGKNTLLRMKILLLKFLKHIIPKKITGSVYFGTGDAYTTARILCILGALYPVYSPEFTVTPDFNEKVIEGRIYFKGRIRLILILWIAIKVKFDKGLNDMIKAVKSL